MSDLQSYLIKTAVEAHNNYRQLHGAPPLKHNPALSKIALEWAKGLAKTNKFEHSKNKYNNENLGECLFMSWGSEKPTKIDGIDSLNFVIDLDQFRSIRKIKHYLIYIKRFRLRNVTLKS